MKNLILIIFLINYTLFGAENNSLDNFTISGNDKNLTECLVKLTTLSKNNINKPTIIKFLKSFNILSNQEKNYSSSLERCFDALIKSNKELSLDIIEELSESSGKYSNQSFIENNILHTPHWQSVIVNKILTQNYKGERAEKLIIERFNRNHTCDSLFLLEFLLKNYGNLEKCIFLKEGGNQVFVRDYIGLKNLNEILEFHKYIRKTISLEISLKNRNNFNCFKYIKNRINSQNVNLLIEQEIKPNYHNILFGEKYLLPENYDFENLNELIDSFSYFSELIDNINDEKIISKLKLKKEFIENKILNLVTNFNANKILLNSNINLIDLYVKFTLKESTDENWDKVLKIFTEEEFLYKEIDTNRINTVNNLSKLFSTLSKYKPEKSNLLLIDIYKSKKFKEEKFQYTYLKGLYTFKIMNHELYDFLRGKIEEIPQFKSLIISDLLASGLNEAYDDEKLDIAFAKPYRIAMSRDKAEVFNYLCDQIVNRPKYIKYLYMERYSIPNFIDFKFPRYIPSSKEEILKITSKIEKLKNIHSNRFSEYELKKVNELIDSLKNQK